jgi:hypothetical protein
VYFACGNGTGFVVNSRDLVDIAPASQTYPAVD